MTEKENLTQAIESPADETAKYGGTIVDARFVEEREEGYFFEFANEQRGLLKKSEVQSPPTKDMSLKVYVEGRAKNGFWILSLWKIAPFELWSRLESLAKSREPLEVKVIGFVEAGLIVNALSMRGFIPKRQIEIYEPSDLSQYVGKTLKCVIVKFDRKDASVILSHRIILEEDLLEEKEELLKSLQVGQIFDARIRQVVQYGVFVDIGSGVEGLVHRSNLTWGREEPSHLFREGDVIKVQVLEINESNGRIAFDHKQLVGDPWKDFVENIAIGQVLPAKVVTLTNFGAFVSLAHGVEGMVHISELSWTNNIRHPKQILTVGQDLEVKVIDIDTNDRRIKLSLKQLEENPWLLIANQYTVGEKYILPISGIADFGIFVTLGEKIDGLIHQSDMAWSGRVENISEKYKVGDEIECVILSIDADNARASLGIKQLSTDPWVEACQKAALGSQITVTIVRIARFGAFAEIIPGVEGLIHISELSSERVEKVEDVVKIGDEVTVTVIRIENEKRRISLSMTAEPFSPSEEQLNEESNAKEEVEQKPQRPTLSDIFPDELKR